MNRLPLLRPGRLAVLMAALSLLGCGSGGGGGSGSGGGGTGGTTPASLSVSPTSLDIGASADTSSSPTADLNITVHNGPASGTYVGASYSSNAIASAAFSATAGAGVLTLTFKDPSVLGPGKYSDTVHIAICTDSSCTKLQAGSELTVPVTYTVTVDATATLSADPTVTGAGLPVLLTWSSTHANSCTASGDWSGTLASSGTQSVTPATAGLHTYTISCSNPGTVAQASVTVTANAPLLGFSAFPATVALGKPVTLRWQGQFATGCTASGDWSGALPASGYRTLMPGATGTTHYHLQCSNAAASDQKDATITVVSAPALPAATAYRINEAHTGVLGTGSIAHYPSQSAPAWTHDLGAPVSYPLVANGVVFVTTANPDSSYGNQLYALDAGTGATKWGPVAIAGTYFGSGLTYDNGRVFVLMFDGDVHAFNATNGAPLWTTQLPGYWYEASPNAYGGIVFVSGNGGLSAIDEATGTILWTSQVGGSTDWSSPAIASEGVYQQDGSCQGSAHDPASGFILWQVSTPCDQPWGYASVIANGTFYGRVGGSLDLVDAATGTFKVQLGSSRAPAITATAIYALNSGVLSATRTSDLAQSWTFVGDGNLVTAPVVVDGTVYVGSTSGNVYAVDAATGAQLWVGTAPQPINYDSENGGPMPPSGPTAGENLLLFLAGNSVVAWQLP